MNPKNTSRTQEIMSAEGFFEQYANTHSPIEVSKKFFVEMLKEYAKQFKSKQ